MKKLPLNLIAAATLAVFAGGCDEKDRSSEQPSNNLQTAQIVQAQEDPLENTIRKVINAYNGKDEKTLNSLIQKDFGLAIFDRPGVYENVSFTDKISFSTPLPNHKDKIHYEPSPEYHCGEEEWNKPSGVYCDELGAGKKLTKAAKEMNKYSAANWSANDLKKFEDIEHQSRKITVVGEDGQAFIFYLTHLNNTWYLTMIDIDLCGG